MTQPSSPQDPGRGNLIRIRNLRAAALNGKGLAAALPAGFNGRWTRRHWMHASLFAMLGTLVMAIVPGFSNAMSSSAAHASAATPLTTLSLLLPPLPASARQAAHVERNNWQLVNVAKGETLSHVFERLQLSKSDLQRVLDHPGARDTLRRLRPGTELAVDMQRRKITPPLLQPKPRSSRAAQALAAPTRTTRALWQPPRPASARQAAHVERNNWQLVNVAKGEPLSHVIERLQLSKSDLQRVLDQPGARDTLRRLRPGTELAFDMQPAAGGKPAALRAFRYDRDDIHRVEIHVDGDKVAQKVIERPVEVRTAVVSGEVGRSLFHSARKRGLSGNNIRSEEHTSSELQSIMRSSY